MANSIRLEIVTPERLFYDNDVELVIVRTLTGDEGFMANHSWACKLLGIGEIWIQEAGSKDFKIGAVSGGFIDVKTEITIFTDSAEWPNEIDVERSKSHMESARDWLKTHSRADTDEAEILKAKVSLNKALTRMHVAQGGGRRKSR
ncbi:MAG: ATP synthase F1 subunit epsilon [Clostridiales Family XIII bacterium]|jgi:F-type H+-transporting ATPase subunit epsilon|nr:ATP synthase F1 subunit epsilon [Clostridiales Family XIII bacterium]